MLIDLHVCATPEISAEALSARLGALELDGAVFAAANAFPTPLPDGRLFAGADIETDRGRYLVVLPDPGAATIEQILDGLPRPWPVRDVVARVQALSGAIVALAPYDVTILHPGGDILYTLPALTGVQTVAPGHPAGIAHAAIEAAEVMGLPCVGGSDALKIDEVGRGATLFSHPVQSYAELIAALNAGACWPVDFGAPSPELLHRGRAAGPREPSAAPAHPHTQNGERRRRRRR